MPNKFERPSNPDHLLYHDVLCGNVAKVLAAIEAKPESIRGNPVVAGAWSHGGRRCAAEDDVIECLLLVAGAGADFSKLGPDTYDSAFKALPRAARLLFQFGADASRADGDGFTALHHMAAIGYRSAAEFLLSQGADLDATNKNGHTALDIALQLNLSRMANYLHSLAESTPGIESIPTPRAQQTRAQQIPAPCASGSSEELSGEVVWYRADRGYGYIRDYAIGGHGIFGELFFDRDCVTGTTPDSIEEEVRVRFAVGHDRFGLYAKRVEFLEG